MPNGFTFTLDVTADRENYYLKHLVTLDNSDVNSRIADGKAVLCMHIECRRNFFRKLVKLTASEGRITVSANELRGGVEVFCCVVAVTELSGYAVAGQHADYGSYRFRVREGDFLAVTETQQFEAFLDFDPLKKISSILTIRRSKSVKEGAMKVELGEPKIVAELSQEDYERYTDLKRDSGLLPLLANQVVVPALMEALAEVKRVGPESDEHDGMMELLWFRSVSARLKQLNIDIGSESMRVAEAVQLLVELPLRRSLAGLFQLVQEDPEA